MASTYTSNAGIELIADGEQTGTWGDTTNTNLEILDRLTNGVGAITLSGTTHTLTTTDGTLSDGHYKVLVFGGTPSGTNTVTVSPNDQDKLYYIVNNSGQSVIISQGSGTTVTVADGGTDIVYCDGAGAGANVASLTADLSGLVAQNGPATLAQVDITAQGDLRLQDSTGGEYVAFQAPATVSASYTLTVPAADGTAGQALVTDGSGALSFGDAGISTGKAIAMSIVFG